LVHVDLQRHEYAAARDRALELVAFYEHAGLQDDPRLATELQNLGFAHEALGESVPARAAWERALELRERILGADHPDIADLVINLASLRGDDERDVAIAELERAIAIYEAAGATESHKAAAAHLNIGIALFEQDRFEAAVDHFERAGDLFEASLGPGADRVVQARFYQAYALRPLERYEEAIAILQRLVGVIERRKEPDRWYAVTVAMLMELELERGEPQAAAGWLDVAERIDPEPLDPEAAFNLRFTILRVRYDNGQRKQTRQAVRELARAIAATPDAFPVQAAGEVTQWLTENR
jgi:tetratricopeptide (TPR) repeat protein